MKPAFFKSAVVFFLAVLSVIYTQRANAQARILVFTKTAGFHHPSIAAGKMAIMKLGRENHFLVDTTSDSTKINEVNLKRYNALVFLNTTGYMLNTAEQVDLQRYIQAGGGFAGIHAATDAEYDWRWYGRMIGAYFNEHPEIQPAVLKVVDKSHISTKMLPTEWKRTDEWYNFRDIAKDLHVLITIDEKSYKGGTNGDMHPMAWYHNFEGGRVWYTELGHTPESYSEKLFLQHLLGGIQYAIGNKAPLDYNKAKTPRVPEENRFIKTQLITGTFFEPTEMTILPNFDILIAQRRGEILMYKNDTKSVKQVGFLPVYFKTDVRGVNAEEGVLGLQADPDFKNNHYVYIYYSPTDTSVNRLSRFTFVNDTIDRKTEKIVLQLYSQRDICCHTGGSIAFGDDHQLFLSTGDNSTPFDEPGKRGGYNIHAFAPLDDRPGHKQYDSRRSAGNTNDLRGKILRIKMHADGTYEIPEGNLFKPGTPLTKPEIYVMGDRNPYRISVDKKTNFLYWGEVGPDAAKDSLDTRGPMGYDELNQARRPGFFGWPLLIGPNIPYRAYDFTTGKSGAAFDPEHPMNNSANNTGLKELPPAQPAYIWYPYGKSEEFPQLGSGSRTAMAGPVYYTDMFTRSTRYPDYYNKKLFFYDWMRGWIKVVTMQPNGDYDNMEPFMNGTKFNSVIDMEVGPDGRLYLLEYGTGWFTKNKDAGLARIDYNEGNRAPEVKSLASNKPSGKLPFTVMLTAVAKDPENDGMTYNWSLGNGVNKTTKQPFLRYTYTKKGTYTASVTAVDDKGAASSLKTLSLYAGNDATAIDAAAIASAKANAPGKALMMSFDCKACHKIEEKSVGPAFTDVAKKYAPTEANKDKLVKKIISGGSGVWGDVAMAAHPDLKPAQARLIVDWVLSLNKK